MSNLQDNDSEEGISFATAVDEITKQVIFDFNDESWLLAPENARQLAKALIDAADSAEGILKQ